MEGPRVALRRVPVPGELSHGLPELAGPRLRYWITAMQQPVSQ